MRNWSLLRYRTSYTGRLPRGFTLIELMVVVAIVAILAIVAYPSYSQYPRRSARAEAQSYLSDVAALQHQYLVDKRSYAPSLAALNTSPAGNVAAKFTVTLAVTDAPPSYTITAQATGNQLQDACPTLTIDNAGNRTPASCW
jgi:type IV pilus assembly protein PilE